MSRAPKFLNSAAELSQLRMVESWMDSHPGWWTVQEIRTGVEVKYGVVCERIQGRLDRLGRRRVVHDRQRYEHSTQKEYQLGAPRTRHKAFGLEAKMFLGEAFEVTVHRSDLDDPVIAAEVEALREIVEKYIRERIVPLVTATSAEDWFEFLTET